MSPDEPHPDDERVRRLLADARHTDPLPTEVAARLDRVLTGLVEDRREADAPVAPVVDLASRRLRRRRLTAGLVAAAAVVALAVSLPRLNITGSGSDAGSTTSADAPAAGELQSDSESRELATAEAPSNDSSAESGAAEPALPPADLRPKQFRKDVAAARDQPMSDPAIVSTVCGEVPPDAEAVVPVQYADRDGYLVFGPLEGDRQAVTLYLCPGGEVARRTTVPAP